MEPTRNPFAVLHHPQYRLLFIGTTLSMLAFGMMQVVQGVVAFQLTGQNGAVGFVMLGSGISMLTLGPLGGTLSDRYSKKKLLQFTQVVIGAGYGLVGVMIVTDTLTIPLLAASTLVMGSMFAVMGPTRQAWIGDILRGPLLANGIALNQLMMNATRIIGPLIAGALIATEAVGAAGTYFTMAALFAGVVLVLSLMEPTPPAPRLERTSVRADLSEGFNYIRRTDDVRLLTLMFFGVVLSGFSYQTLMPGYLENELGHPSSHLGFLFGTTALGGIATTLVLASRRPQHTSTLQLSFAGGLAGSLMLLAFAPGFGAALLVAALVGAASSGFQMLNNVNLMERADKQYFGRVMAVTMMAFGLNSVVAYPIGEFADAFGERLTLGVLACGCTAITVLGWFAFRSVFGQQPMLERAVAERPAAGR